MRKEELMEQNRELQKEISDMKDLLEEIYGAVSAGQDIDEKKAFCQELKVPEELYYPAAVGRVRGLIDRYRRQRKGI